jgi:hypothetical protein
VRRIGWERRLLSWSATGAGWGTGLQGSRGIEGWDAAKCRWQLVVHKEYFFIFSLFLKQISNLGRLGKKFQN